MSEDEQDVLGADVEENETLDSKLIKSGLSQCGPAGSSGFKAFAFTRLELENKELRSLDGDLKSFKDLQFLSLAHNELTSLEPLKVLQFLSAVNAQKNSITSITNFGAELKYLELLQVDYNQIEELKGYNLPTLKALMMSSNLVTGFQNLESKDAVELETLDLSNNIVTSLAGIGFFKELRTLNLYGNKLDSVEGIHDLPRLEMLNLGDNQLTTKDIDVLAGLPELRELVLAGNASIDADLGEDGALMQIILKLPMLTVFNGKTITLEDRTKAQNERKAKEREEEAARAAAHAEKEAEEAEAAAAASAEAGGVGDEGDGEE